MSDAISALTSFCLAVVLAGGLLPAAPARAAGDEWTTTIQVQRPWRRNRPAVGHLWIPEDCKTVRGLLLGGKIMLEKRISLDPQVRRALAEKDMGVLYFEPGLDGVFNYVGRDSDEKLLDALARLAKKTGRPEIELVPWLTVGHSTGGIGARNIAYWKPHRVIGIIHVMSGNLQDGLYDKQRSLAGVPFLAINGEFERYGPKGGDLGVGLRKKYSLHPTDKRKRNQTQWVMIRMQLLDRRRKNPSNLMGLIVHRGAGHTSWSDEMSALCAQFVRSAADARIPKTRPGGKSVVRCVELEASDGWLTDPDIKDPEYKPAPYDRYEGDKTRSLWHVDGPMAKAVYKYHDGPWKDPDPTAGLPPEQRYTPPPILRDLIDAPEPKELHWKGGDGIWGGGQGKWSDDGRAAEWNADRQAILTDSGGRVQLAGDVKCAGLTLGKGYVLAMGTHSLRADWHGELRDGCRIELTLRPQDRKGRRGRLHFRGNLTLAGTVSLRAAGDLPEGEYRIATAGGRLSGKFAKVNAPTDYAAEVQGGMVTLKKEGDSP